MDEEELVIQTQKKDSDITVQQKFDNRVNELRSDYQRDRGLKGMIPTAEETNKWIVGQVVNGLKFAGFPDNGSDEDKNQALDTIAEGLGNLSQSRLEEWAEREGNGSKLLSGFLISPQQQMLIERVNWNKEKDKG